MRLPTINGGELARVVLPLLTIACWCGCQTTHPEHPIQPERLSVQGAYLHAGSKITMPETVDVFERNSLVRYDADGLDVSAGYDLIAPAHHIVATVYIYPAPALTSIGSSPDIIAETRATLTEREFEHRKDEIQQVHSGAALIDQNDAAHVEGGQSYPGKVANYEYQEEFVGSKQTLCSQLFLFCFVGGKWSVEYRFTHPKSENDDREIQEFINQWKWHTGGG